jgi:hypothetical protein
MAPTADAKQRLFQAFANGLSGPDARENSANGREHRVTDPWAGPSGS